MPDIVPGSPETYVFVIITLTLGATMLGLPERLAPFAAGLFGVLLTLGLNWSSLESVERVVDVVVAGFFYGAAAIGTHKTVKTLQEELFPGPSLSDEEIRAMVVSAHERSVPERPVASWNRDEGPGA